MDWLSGTVVGRLLQHFTDWVVKWTTEPFREKKTEPKPNGNRKILTKADLKKMSNAQLTRRIQTADDRIAGWTEEIRLERRQKENCKTELKRRTA